ncbi:MAG: transposase [Byssovorax sp.]
MRREQAQGDHRRDVVRTRDLGDRVPPACPRDRQPAAASRLDGKTWKAGSRAFLFPIKAMARLLRGKLIDALKEAHAQKAFAGFDDFHDPEGFARLLRKLWKLDWIVYAKPAFARGAHVLSYLGRYTHRVALSNSRLLDVTPHQVTFRTKGDGTETLSPVALLRRFVQHVLPNGFHKIRHVGLHASPEKRRRAQDLCGAQGTAPVLSSLRDQLLERTGRDLRACPVCNAVLRAIPLPTARAPPAEVA